MVFIISGSLKRAPQLLQSWLRRFVTGGASHKSMYKNLCAGSGELHEGFFGHSPMPALRPYAGHNTPKVMLLGLILTLVMLDLQSSHSS